MRLLHLADLHLGKSIGNYSLIEDQAHALKQILEIIDDENIDVVMMAGDIFDTPVASIEALSLYSDFIDEIIFKKQKIILAISGNHDSAKRLDINSKFFTANNFYMVGEYRDDVITLKDSYGDINFHLIPYIPLNQAKLIFDPRIENFTDVYKYALKDRDLSGRNVLITHCYANTVTIENENLYTEGQKPLTIGGSDAMDGHLFLDFDYAALGHLHAKHYVIDPKIRYSGTFMQYAFDDPANKSVTVIDITDKVDIKEVPIKPLRSFKTVRGKFDEILKLDPTDDYLKVVLDDEGVIDNAMAKLKEKFPHVVQIAYTSRGIFNQEASYDVDLTGKSSLDLFREFYKFKMDEDISEAELSLIEKVIE